MTRLLVNEVVEYELEQSEGESLADVYQRFLDDPNIYLTGITDRQFTVDDSGEERTLTPMEEISFRGVENRS